LLDFLYDKEQKLPFLRSKRFLFLLLRRGNFCFLSYKKSYKENCYIFCMIKNKNCPFWEAKNISIDFQMSSFADVTPPGWGVHGVGGNIVIWPMVLVKHRPNQISLWKIKVLLFSHFLLWELEFRNNFYLRQISEKKLSSVFQTNFLRSQTGYDQSVFSKIF
jgi:hypothetical protein